jgi:hypothetical protein
MAAIMIPDAVRCQTSGIVDGCGPSVVSDVSMPLPQTFRPTTCRILWLLSRQHHQGLFWPLVRRIWTIQGEGVLGTLFRVARPVNRHSYLAGRMTDWSRTGPGGSKRGGFGVVASSDSMMTWRHLVSVPHPTRSRLRSSSILRRLKPGRHRTYGAGRL